MSKKYAKKNTDDHSMDFCRYLMDCEEGEYITKRFSGNSIRDVYIYSSTANVNILSSSDGVVTATLLCVKSEKQYFEMFMLDEDTLYIFATCDVQSLAQSNLFVALPEDVSYNVQIVTNLGDVRIDDGVSTWKQKVDIGNGIVPKE